METICKIQKMDFYTYIIWEKFAKIYKNLEKKNEKFVKKKLYGDNTPKNAVGYGRVAEQATTESE